MHGRGGGPSLSRRKTTFPFLFRSYDTSRRLKPRCDARGLDAGMWTRNPLHSSHMHGRPGYAIDRRYPEILVSSLTINNLPGARRAHIAR